MSEGKKLLSGFLTQTGWSNTWQISEEKLVNVAKVGAPCFQRAVDYLAALPLNRFNAYAVIDLSVG